MPERITLEDQALTRLKRLTQADSVPVIGPADLQDILSHCKRAELWVAETAYAVGAVVQPNTPNGHRYVCIIAGTSDDNEPTFTEWREGQTSDGDDLVWEEAGSEYLCLWDLTRAAYMVMDQKLNMATCAVDVKTGEMSKSASQIFTHLKTLRDSFVTAEVG